jgi:thiamine-phosphate pyrophosphorylase
MENPKLLRLLDANLNRCREGLRVLEDTARFIWSDESLFSLFRAHRHALDHVTRKFYPELLKARDSQADHGRTIPEVKRSNLEAVVFSNFRRCEESLRVLEEYSKIWDGNIHAQFKKIRFKMYALEKKVGLGCHLKNN